MTEKELQEIETLWEGPFPVGGTRDVCARLVKLFIAEIRRVKAEYHEYKVYYDRIFEKSIVVPADEYAASADNITKLRAVADAARAIVNHPNSDGFSPPWVVEDLRAALDSQTTKEGGG